MKKTKKIILLATLALIGCVCLIGCGPKEPTPTTKVEQPVGLGKQPSQYTWEEYQAMTESQKQAFRESFGSDAVFRAWLEAAEKAANAWETTGIDLPWETGGKQPRDYTWEEFEALSGELQIAFQNSFGSTEAFDAWLREAQYRAEMDTLELPWENGGKEPKDYTMAEFEALTPAQQIAFQDSFPTQADFDAWLQSNLPEVTEPTEEALQLPWENGGKKPEDYTWAEFEALSGELQIAFQNSFDTQADFDAWLQKNLIEETEPETEDPEAPWENGGKQPKDYTWAEFEALTAEQQMMFQNSFPTQADFDAWLQKNLPVETEPPVEDPKLPWERPGAKQPKDYTWAEFEALSGELQMAFQNSFASFTEFEAWLQRVNP